MLDVKAFIIIILLKAFNSLKNIKNVKVQRIYVM